MEINDLTDLARKAGFQTGSIDLADGSGSYGFIKPVGCDCTMELSRFAAMHLELISRKDAWRPIDTAPKHLDEIDIWNGERVPNCFWGVTTYGREAGWVYQADYDSNGPVIELVRKPTHWMPLPEPPKDGE